jgi:hypothetical protein
MTGADMKIFTILVVGALMAFSGLAVAQEAVIGSVKTVSGSASIIRNGSAIPAKVGDRLHENDTLETGKDGSLGVIFRDDTVLSLGPDSQIVVNEFVFQPLEGELGIVTKMFKGTAAYLSGEIVKLSPESARFETPLATIGIRGTRFVVKVKGD